MQQLFELRAQLGVGLAHRAQTEPARDDPREPPRLIAVLSHRARHVLHDLARRLTSLARCRLALRGLSSQETAKRGNIYGIVGMAIAIGAIAVHGVVHRPS